MDLQVIQNKIFEIRGFRVMTDFHLAELYRVETRVLKQAVKRNIERFPDDDFMFSLSKSESELLIDMGVSQNVIPRGYNTGGAAMLVFTQEGIAMISSILRSPVAVQVNISIMRAFVAMRQMVIGYDELRQRIEQLEISTDAQFAEIYSALTELLSKKETEDKPRRPIGFLSYNQNNE
jgi:hypothetical protein